MSRIQAGRRRKACHHEAGHALVRWYFGFATDRAVVLTTDELRAGNGIRTGHGTRVGSEGMVIGSDILEPPYGPRVSGRGRHDQAAEDKWRIYRRDVELIDCLAGFHAEARYGHMPVTVAALLGGDRDVARFRDIMDGWFPGVRPADGHAEYVELEGRVTGWAKALVASPCGREAIGSVADAIHAQGTVSGRRIAGLCRRAYGGRQCAFEAWSPSWPPTLAQLREGFIPGA